MIQRFSSSCWQITTVLQNSVLKKSQTVCHLWSFSKKSPVDFLRCIHGFLGQMPCHATPAKVQKKKKIIILAKNSKGKVKFSVALNQWKMSKWNIIKVGFEEAKIKSMTPRSLYISFYKQPNHCAHQGHRETYKIDSGCKNTFEVSLALVSGARRSHRGVRRT